MFNVVGNDLDSSLSRGGNEMGCKVDLLASKKKKLDKKVVPRREDNVIKIRKTNRPWRRHHSALHAFQSISGYHREHCEAHHAWLWRKSETRWRGPLNTLELVQQLRRMCVIDQWERLDDSSRRLVIDQVHWTTVRTRTALVSYANRLCC